ncbi:MAG: toll/interleukin-1 receptor domain-containing protein [Desulfomonile tiedjei]|nr:toll/interleukin-1 receptor domain-containing protein [Desulfomonile tiedjei]
MKVFISWSGQLSHEIALGLREWLPSVVQVIVPYVSSEDITKGSQWFAHVATELEQTDFGVICLTKENLRSPWIFFEAGALSKSVSRSHVSPLLIDLSPSDLQGPLVQFQAVMPTEKDMFKLLNTINADLQSGRLDEPHLQKSFARWWPDFDSQIQDAKKRAVQRGRRQATPHDGQKDQGTDSRSERAVLEEVLQNTRLIAQSVLETDSSLKEIKARHQDDNTPIALDPPNLCSELERGGHVTSRPIHRSRYTEAENYALKNLEDGRNPKEVIASLERNGIPQKTAIEIVREITKDLQRG